MSNNRLPLLIGLLVLLCGVAWLAGAFDSAPSTIDVPSVSVPTEALDRLVVARPGDEFETRRETGSWQLVYPVFADLDSAQVGTFLRSLAALEPASVVSTNPDRYGRFGVDSTAAVLTAAWGIDSVTVVVSESGPDYQSTYVRIDDDPRVFATRQRLALPADMNTWREKRLWTPVTAQAIGASVQSPDGDFEVRYDAEGWMLIRDGQPTPADSLGVSRWLQRLRVVRADGFADERLPDEVRASATHVLSIGYADGSSHSMSLVEHVDAYSIVSDGGVMTLNSSRVGSYFIDPQTLVPTE